MAAPENNLLIKNNKSLGAAFFQKGGVLRSFLKKASPKTSL
ncbi:hypothetical protein [Komagataeibacter xylinus]|nr:hypothetical protein [Komagataeibacter xylinus]